MQFAEVNRGSKPLKSDCHLSKQNLLFTLMIALKNDEKCILFHYKSFFRSQDI